MLDEEAISLFRAEMKGVKPLKQDTVVVTTGSHRKKAQEAIKEQREQQDTLFYFSDE